MPSLSDRQRVEIAIPVYPLLALTTAPAVIGPAEPELASKAEADIATMRTELSKSVEAWVIRSFDADGCASTPCLDHEMV